MSQTVHILVGIDYTQSSVVALERALEMAPNTDAVLDLVVVVPKPQRVANDELKQLEASVEDNLARIQEFAAPICERRGVAPKLCMHVRVGQPAEALMQAAVDFNSDLLVVGTHARSGLERWRLGSVAEELVRHARLPVVVAKEKDFTGLAKTAVPDAPTPGLELHRSQSMSRWMNFPNRVSHVSGLL